MVRYWMEQVRTYKDEDADVFLLGNKIDIADKRVISYDEGKVNSHKHIVTLQLL